MSLRMRPKHQWVHPTYSQVSHHPGGRRVRANTDKLIIAVAVAISSCHRIPAKLKLHRAQLCGEANLHCSTKFRSISERRHPAHPSAPTELWTGVECRCFHVDRFSGSLTGGEEEWDFLNADSDKLTFVVAAALENVWIRDHFWKIWCITRCHHCRFWRWKLTTCSDPSVQADWLWH